MAAFLSFIDPISKIIERVIPDKAAQDAAKANLAQIQASGELQIILGQMTADTQAMGAVNQTMQAEAKSEHWAQWLWRPAIGFTFAFTIIMDYCIHPYFPSLAPVVIPAEVWTAMLVILGAASGLRGYQKVVQAQKQ